MSNLFIPGKPEPPKPGLAIQVDLDGSNVVLKITSTLIMSPEQANELGNALVLKAAQAASVAMAITNGANLVG